MHVHRRIHQRRLSIVIVEARAGLLPASDDLDDEKQARMRRTSRMGRIILAYEKLGECGSQKLAVATALADLRHYCDCKNLNFDELNLSGENVYLGEIDNESGKCLGED